MSGSELTIYQNAVDMEEGSGSDSDNNLKRFSSPSEDAELVNTSDELITEINDQLKPSSLEDNDKILF